MSHREEFENLTNYEQPLAAMIRALGLYETKVFEKHGHVLAADAFEASHWLQMWQAVRVLLSGDRGHMDGATLYACLEALAKNAGFSASDYV